MTTVRPGNAPASARNSARADIQAVRAIAVIAVILNHLFSWPSGAFVGVDVFFVISGFLITGLLLREYERTGTISFRGFYARRVKRIIPAAALVLLVTVSAASFLFTRPRFVSTAIDSVWALFSAANWRFAATGTDYFQQGLPPSPLQHYWSLGVEEQFYLVWPWLMLGVLALVIGRFGVPRTRSRRVVGIAIVVLSVASLAWALWDTKTDVTVAYFSTFSRAWELGVGALVAIAGNRLAIRDGRSRALLAWIGVAGIVVSLFVVPSSPGFPAPWALLPVLSTGLVIAAGVGGQPRFFAPLTNPVSRYIGDISYSLYLWHFPVVVLLVTLLPSDSAPYYVIALVLIAALSIASYHWVENPIRSLRWTEVRFGRRRFVPKALRAWQYLGAGVLTILALVIAGSVFVSAHTAPAGSASAASPRVQTNASNPSAATLCLGAAALDPNKHCPVSSGDFIYPSVSQASVDQGAAFDCWIGVGKPLKTCEYGNGPVRVALVGDSHAASLIPALLAGLKSTDWTLDTYVGDACQFSAGGTGTSCAGAMKDIRAKLETGTKYDIVITTAARTTGATDRSFAATEYEKEWQKVTARGTRLVVVADNPGVSAAALECISRIGFEVTHNSCGTPVATAFEVKDPLITAAAHVEGAHLVDLNKLYCTTKTCPAVIGNVVTYRDTLGHITATFSKTLAPYLISAIEEAVARS